MPTLKGCKQLVKELFLKHFLLPHHLHHNFGAAARGQHFKDFFLFVNCFSEKPSYNHSANSNQHKELVAGTGFEPVTFGL
jgi:hypothetical protein